MRFIINQLPDPSHHRHVARFGHDIEELVKKSCEQMLRIFSGLNAGSATLALRFIYSPNKPKLQRMKIELVFNIHQPEYETMIQNMVQSGLLDGLYQLQENDSNNDNFSYSYCSEIVRREDAWIPDSERKNRLNNDDIPEMYYNLFPFQPAKSNDWKSMDQLLGRFTSEACVEVMISPADIFEERKTHYDYITQLMSVNQYGGSNNSGLLPDDEIELDVQVEKGRDPMADEVLRDQEELHRRMREPHLHFNIHCWAENTENASLLAATVAGSAFEKGQYRILHSGNDSSVWGNLKKSFKTVQPSDHLLYPAIWEKDDIGLFINFKRLSHLATVEELGGIFGLPLGNSSAPLHTIGTDTDPEPIRLEVESLLVGDDIRLSDKARETYPENLKQLFKNSSPGQFELRLKAKELNKHVFIAGVPGSGKTTAMFNLITQLSYFKKPVPFLVIEPAKTEYRTFKSLKCHPDPVLQKMVTELQVYTVGNEINSPFRFNPLAYDKRISLDEHIGSVLSCFAAAMPMGGPLMGLLAESLEEVYENPPVRRKFPRLKDLLLVARRIVETKGYEGEIKGNLSAALEVRLGLLTRRSLGKVFDCDEGLPDFKGLFENNVILEMDYLTQEHACLMSLFVLSSMREYIRVTRSSGSELTHITVLEEAHNIVGTSTNTGGEEGADPKAYAAQYVSRMLAELRALGEGVLIADQLPTAVAPEVVKNTGTKIIHRLVSKDDREEIGASMLLDGTDVEELARLNPGEAFIYTGDLYRPRRIQALGSHIYLAQGQPGVKPELPQPPGRDKINKILDGESWFIENRKKRVNDILEEFSLQKIQLNEIIESARNLLAKLEDKIFDVINGEDPFDFMKHLMDSAKEMEKLSMKIEKEFYQFLTEMLNFETEENTGVEILNLQNEFGFKIIPLARSLAKQLRKESLELINLKELTEENK